jgi:hypothetical protein
MKTLRRSSGAVVFLAGLLLAVSAFHLHWYFRVNGQVVVNGHTTTGYLHADAGKTFLMLTRTDDAQAETYLISLKHETKAGVLDCGAFHPLRFLPFPVGHLNPPCVFFSGEPVKFQDPPIPATLTTGRNFVDFSTASGKKVRGQW